jgi:Asp-tRNA(Asn)/Glu-tRNA(Gln) amidotransferase A subunit family amidase
VSDLFELTLGDALRAVRRGVTSPEDIARACLQRIEARDPQVRAFECRTPPSEVLRCARVGQGKGLLSGLPVALKDTIETADLPTRFGSSIYLGNTPSTDAACVVLLKRAGAALVGKTATAELAYISPAETRNPRDIERTPGGSSSGSAAAVADCMVPAALGAQTAGSVTRPAAYCGVVGYVASQGELPLRGVQPLSPSLDALGVLTRSVEDIQIMRSVLLDVAFTPQSPPSTPRIALVLPALPALEPVILDATLRVADRLDADDADVRAVELDDMIFELIEHHSTVMAFEVARTLAYEAGLDGALSDELRHLIDEGRRTSYGAYRRARAAVEAIRARHREVLGGFDAVLTPAATGPAPVGLASTGSPEMSRPWQALGLPAITLPTSAPQDGAPLGIQLVGARHGDDALLGLARWVEGLLSIGRIRVRRLGTEGKPDGDRSHGA